MATKNDEAAKAAKQKKLLIGLGVGLLVVGGIQVPRLLGGKDEKPAAAAASATGVPAVGDSTGTPTSTPTVPLTAPVAAPVALLPGEAGKKSPRTTLVGVSISSGGTVRAAQGQLASFSLFKPKDPFKPQVTDGQGSSGATTAAKPTTTPETPAAAVPTPKPVAPVVQPTPPSVPATVGPAEPVVETPPPAEPVTPVEPPRFATVSVDGTAESLEVGGTFPESEPMFVLVKVKPDFVRIGIAGGKLENGSTVLVKIGNSITLVDSATGVRYVVEVIAVGAQPDLEFTSSTPGSPPALTTPTQATGTP